MSQEVIRVKPEHIEKGIQKYHAERDVELNAIINRHGFDYTVYRFQDGRVLLVLPHNISAFLYKNEDHLFDSLDLT
ncbi:MAG: hypothetical protein WD048_13265 [Chitinophagales bacterium]